MLENETILITGSSRGIGAATARLAVQYGAEVILHGKTNSKELQALSNELDSKYIVCDVSDIGACKQQLDEVTKIDVLINNAGINPSKKFLELSSGDWKEIFDVNVMGVIYFSRIAIEKMLESGGGKIINISSIKGLPYVSGKPAYAASKAAVTRITSSMAEEFASKNILVNAVAPGFVETKMTERTLSEEIKKQIDTIPLGRLASPKEIAETILFLASDKSSYTTGQTFIIDGGFSIKS